MQLINHMRLEFDARPENESFARIAVSAFTVPFNPTLDVLSDIRTAISEAVTNAIVHAYQERGEPSPWTLACARMDGCCCPCATGAAALPISGGRWSPSLPPSRKRSAAAWLCRDAVLYGCDPRGIRGERRHDGVHGKAASPAGGRAPRAGSRAELNAA